MELCLATHERHLGPHLFDGYRPLAGCDGLLRAAGYNALETTRAFADCGPDDLEHYHSALRFKQICTYIMVWKGRRLLAYRRRSDHGMGDLAGAWSLGVGGHVESRDLVGPGGERVGTMTGGLAEPDVFLACLGNAAARELAEELPGWVPDHPVAIGLVHDQTGAGQRHLGVVFRSSINEKDGLWCPGPDRELAEIRWVTPPDAHSLNLEPWSRALVDAIAHGMIEVPR